MEYAGLSRFYGLSPREIDAMEMCQYNEYLRAIPAIKASEQLTDIETVLYPKLKEDKARGKIRRRIEKDLRCGEEEVYRSPKDIARMLKDG